MTIRTWLPTARAWDVLGGDVDVEFITEHLSSDALMAALANAEVVVAMRERTPFSANVIAGLPTLRLLVTTGMANSSIDLAAARGPTESWCAARDRCTSPTVELTWALILGSFRRLPAEDASMRSGEWQTQDRGRPRRQNPGRSRSGPAGTAGRQGGPGVRPAGDRLVDQPRFGAGYLAWGCAGEQGRTARPVRRRDRASEAGRPVPRNHRSGANCAP